MIRKRLYILNLVEERPEGGQGREAAGLEAGGQQHRVVRCQRGLQGHEGQLVNRLHLDIRRPGILNKVTKLCRLV